jgi:cellulose biosynthesis protein BcsQ
MSQAKIITLYNNKGGVSKTTTLFNLAVLLAQKGHKTLIADCDPQCNVTELFFASDEDAYDPSRDLPGTSIYDALKPRFEGEVGQIDAKTVNLAPSSLYGNLFLLRGDLEFALAERYFANAAFQAITENVHEKNTYVSLWRLLTGLGSFYGFDYILCDVGPSTGAISQMTLLACDGFFLPLYPDRFSNQAVTVLGHVLSGWISRHQEVIKTFKPFQVQVFSGQPALLGAIIQDFKVHSGAKAKKSYDRWRQRIKSNIQQSLLSHNIPLGPNFNPKSPFVASIRDVGPMAPVAQMFGRAIFDVQRQNTTEASTTGQAYGGVVWEGWEGRKTEYREQIANLVECLP